MSKNIFIAAGFALALISTSFSALPANAAPTNVQATASNVNVVTAKAASKKINYKYTTANLNMRSGASTKHRVVKTLKKGTKVTVVSAIKGWGKVKASGKTGWVSSKYLSSSQPRVSAPLKRKAPQSQTQKTAVKYLKSFGCSTVPVTWVSGVWWNGQVNLGTRTMKLNKNMPSSRIRYVTAHECHHIKQSRAYKGDWNRLYKDLRRVHPGVSNMTAIERNADCATNRLGISQHRYASKCTAKQKAAAKRIWEGKRAF